MKRLDTLIRLTCLRCGHTWLPRGLTIYLCPKCRSPRWDEEDTA